MATVTSMEPGEPQQLFIEESLQSMRERKWTLSMHHVPLYPSSFASPKGEVLRAYWEDLFLDGGVDIAFEHHEHSYKRNHLVAHEEVPFTASDARTCGHLLTLHSTRQRGFCTWAAAHGV